MLEAKVVTIIQKRYQNGDLDPFFSGISIGETGPESLEGAEKLISGMIKASKRWEGKFLLSRGNFILTVISKIDEQVIPGAGSLKEPEMVQMEELAAITS